MIKKFAKAAKREARPDAAADLTAGRRMSLRVVFMGTPDFAVPTLAAIVGQGHEVAAVYTRAPAPAGRGMALKPSPVHALAERFGIPVLHADDPARPRTRPRPSAALDADVAVVVAYGMILPQAILDAPRARLPQPARLAAAALARRGADPARHHGGRRRDRRRGDAMEEGLDTGPVAMAERVAIGPDMTAGELHDRLAPLGADLMVRALAALVARRPRRSRRSREEGVTYAHKIDERGGADRLGAAGAGGARPHPRPLALSRRLLRGRSRQGAGAGQGAARRAGRGRGPAGHAARRRACTVACGEGAVRLLEVQRAGKGADGGGASSCAASPVSAPARRGSR